MRLTVLRTIMVAVMLMGLVLAGGCEEEDAATTNSSGSDVMTSTTVETPLPYDTPDPTQTVPDEQESPYGVGQTGSQSVGTLVDGLQLRDIRYSDHGSYYRIVFEMGTSEGDLLLQVPHADASMSADGTQITVTLGGIRSIGSSESVTSSSLESGDLFVKAFKRMPAADDQALVYYIELESSSTYSMTGLGSPGRIIVDITKQ